jgi:hypothetical protein
MTVETHHGAGEIHATRVPGVDAAPAPRRRRWRYVPRRIDNRTRIARRAKALREYFTSALTAAGREMTVELVAAVGKAAELTSISEDMRARMLRGAADVCADDLVRVERLSGVALRALHLPSAASKQAPSLSQIIAEHEGAE